MNYVEFSEGVSDVLYEKYGVRPEDADMTMLYFSTAEFVKRKLARKYHEFAEKSAKQELKTVCYLSMEFLLGKSLKNNLLNLGLLEHFNKYADSSSVKTEDIFAVERDAGLGNGGLGRLAASYLEALATGGYRGVGCSLLYEYGMFEQVIREGEQIELPDKWLKSGEVWLEKNNLKYYKVKILGDYDEQTKEYSNYKELRAVSYDMYVSGYSSDGVSLLKLWKAMPSPLADMTRMTEGEFDSLNESVRKPDVINMFLYPPDNTDEGKKLRVVQQYFFVSASVQYLIAEHYKKFQTVENLSDHVAFHINDTHPALCIPEIIRVLCDDYDMTFDMAYEVARTSVSYTNHTVMPEALEVWDEDIVSEMFPRIYSLIKVINNKRESIIYGLSPTDWNSLPESSVISSDGIHMARLAVLCSSKVNGVSSLHTDIIKNTLFSNYHRINPSRFVNVTNGISYRRWLCSANEPMSALIDSAIGTGYKERPYELEELKKLKNDRSFIDSFEAARYKNKMKLSNTIKRLTDIDVDPRSMFDVQIKRLHEYKRQLLNVIKILSYYCEITDTPNVEISPKTFIFSAKAAPTYYHAKRIIKLINKCGEMIRADRRASEILNVVFIPDYSVSLAEIIIPASDVSEQISLAGKEASGTGNMKFMINGALTIGTYDGANVEISELAGDENIYIFGMTVEEVKNADNEKTTPKDIMIGDKRLSGVIDMLRSGIAGEDFSDIADYLIKGTNPDPYFCLYDYHSYMSIYHQLCIDYNNKTEFYRKGIMNVASAGYFASDRSIEEYANKIWFAKNLR